MKWLADREILDCGYQEIMVRAAFGRELVDGGMRVVNEEPVNVWVVDEWPAWDAVLLRVQPVVPVLVERSVNALERVAA